MKHDYIFITIACLIGLSACASKQHLVLPCETQDTDTEFYSVGVATGSVNNKGILQHQALFDAHIQLGKKLYSVIQSFIQEEHPISINNDFEKKFLLYCELASDSISNEAYQNCMRISGVNKNGITSVFLSIKISSEFVVAEFGNYLDLVLTEEEKRLIGFDKQNFSTKLYAFIKEQ